MSIARSLKATSAAVARSVCAASQLVSDRAHHGAAALAAYMNEEKNTYVIQAQVAP